MSPEMYFSDITLDMLAFESALLQFECENDLTDEYLNNEVSYDALSEANESASAEADDMASDFAFGADLFMATIAMEAEGAEGTDSADTKDGDKKDSKSGFGAKIKSGFMTVINTIKKFFNFLADKVKGLLKSIKDKINSYKLKGDAKKLSKIQSEVLKQASSVKSNVGKCIGILKKVINTNAAKIKSICQDINIAITAAGRGNGSVADDEGAAAIGKAYKETGDKSVNKAESLVSDCENSKEQFEKAMNILNESVTNLMSSTAKLKIHETAAMTVPKAGESEADTSTRFSNIATATNKSVDDFNAKNSKGISKNADTQVNKSERLDAMTTVTKDMVRSILMQDFYASQGDVKGLIDVCDEIVKICGENQDFCSKMAAIADKVNNDNKDAKRGYTLCKLYLRASNIFTYFSTELGKLASGSYIKTATGD